jgi:hypothetical protein
MGIVRRIGECRPGQQPGGTQYSKRCSPSSLGLSGYRNQHVLSYKRNFDGNMYETHTWEVLLPDSETVCLEVCQLQYDPGWHGLVLIHGGE